MITFTELTYENLYCELESAINVALEVHRESPPYERATGLRFSMPTMVVELQALTVDFLLLACEGAPLEITGEKEDGLSTLEWVARAVDITSVEGGWQVRYEVEAG